MHLEALVEEASAEAALVSLLPKILGEGHTFRIHPHLGKADLLGLLERRLRGYARWLPSDWRIVVVVDQDRVDFRRLKDTMEASAMSVGLITKTRAGVGPFAVLNRIAMESLRHGSWAIEARILSRRHAQGGGRAPRLPGHGGRPEPIPEFSGFPGWGCRLRPIAPN